jgi:VanZ family protein
VLAKTSARARLAAFAWAALAVQLAVLYVPRLPSTVPSGPPGLDKVVHAAIFAVAGWAWARLWPRWRWLVATAFVAQGLISEFVQWRFLPGRSGDLWDLASDLVGLALGLWLAWRWRFPPTD